MLALLFDGTVRLCTDVPVPSPMAGDALIRVRLAGVCNTDIEITRGYKGFHGILGHEFMGVVAECADRDWIGRRVCGEINVTCGVCGPCTRGLSTHCVRREVLGILSRDGAFAEYLVLPIRNLHAVPDALSDDEAVFVEPVAAAFEILEQVPIGTGTRVAVLGDGKLGLLCAQVTAQAGADTLLLGKHAAKLRKAREMGLRAVFTREAEGTQVDIVIEATGSSTGVQRAIQLVAPRGTIVLKSTTTTPVDLDASALVVNEITVVGSRCGPFPEAIAALENGSVQVLPLIDDRFPLSDGVEALERAAQPGVMKVLIDVERQGRG